MVTKPSKFCGMDAPGNLPKKKTRDLFFRKDFFTIEVDVQIECILLGLHQKRSQHFCRYMVSRVHLRAVHFKNLTSVVQHDVSIVAVDLYMRQMSKNLQ